MANEEKKGLPFMSDDIGTASNTERAESGDVARTEAIQRGESQKTILEPILKQLIDLTKAVEALRNEIQALRPTQNVSEGTFFPVDITPKAPPDQEDQVRANAIDKANARRARLGKEPIDPGFQAWNKAVKDAKKEHPVEDNPLIPEKFVFHGNGPIDRDSEEWKPNTDDIRQDGSQKGTGFLGVLPIKGPDGKTGIATEYSTKSDAVKVDGKKIDFPSLVPGLTEKEVVQMTDDIIPLHKPIPEPIMQKAIDHANKRLSEGKPVFAEPDESPSATRETSPVEQNASLTAIATTLQAILTAVTKPNETPKDTALTNAIASLSRKLDDSTRNNVARFA